ncbi:MAG: hypothetical protein UV58_C0005G0025 [Candidatus Wolfebacteria bacterium GW2011_GWC1_43_10]|uniref:Uncharacterized protein n=1 Tax=Candidatus Wolfebacteria bacterium GW2011_GWC1_43_10 TaxID=1619011 RepID=A0A0G1EIC2_9BACT|nr:MAG: hypothetical protein UV58_C0005G0025 [Candidatus Wolfebacteria bacterium GW2011_GWC1_43_10]KKT23158.1 MAG: hypothetical protein UW08_C0001G0121 [Parcubacteria group bacterium GW2011_GWB1_43_8b]
MVSKGYFKVNCFSAMIIQLSVIRYWSSVILYDLFLIGKSYS